MQVVPTAYLAPISYYRVEPTYVEVYETFPKQTMRNRCNILGANGVITLTIPVCHSETKQLTKDVRISYEHQWQHIHWNTLMSAYKHSAFFDYYSPFFKPFYTKQYEYLVDYNMALYDVVEALLNNEPPNGKYQLNYTTTWQGEDLEGGWESKDTPHPYYQLFTDTFIDNLSIVDLLFNMGSESRMYI